MAVIHCTVESVPQAQLAVRKGGELLASSLGSGTAHGHRLSSSPTYNGLRVEIRDVVMEDEGEYLCSATNPYGSTSSSAMLVAESEQEPPRGPPGRLREVGGQRCQCSSADSPCLLRSAPPGPLQRAQPGLAAELKCCGLLQRHLGNGLLVESSVVPFGDSGGACHGHLVLRNALWPLRSPPYHPISLEYVRHSSERKHHLHRE